MQEANKVGLVKSPYNIKKKIVECTKRFPHCLGKFVVVRKSQPEICTRCLERLGILDEYPLIKIHNTKWKN